MDSASRPGADRGLDTKANAYQGNPDEDGHPQGRITRCGIRLDHGEQHAQDNDDETGAPDGFGGFVAAPVGLGSLFRFGHAREHPTRTSRSASSQDSATSTRTGLFRIVDHSSCPAVSSSDQSSPDDPSPMPSRGKGGRTSAIRRMAVSSWPTRHFWQRTAGGPGGHAASPGQSRPATPPHCRTGQNYEEGTLCRPIWRVHQNGAVTSTVKAYRMPGALKAAQFIITLEVAFGLVGLAITLAGFFSTFHWGILPALIYAVGRIALLGWLLSRWSSRRMYLRWAIIAVHLLEIGAAILDLALFSTATWNAVFGSHLLQWAVIILLLLPSAGRWFSESRVSA